MRITQALTRSAAVIIAVAGVGLAVAGPASASVPPGGNPLGTWHAFGNTNPISSSSSRWVCGITTQIGINVDAQVCVVESSDTISVQPAVIVRNDKPIEYNATAEMTLKETGIQNPRTFTYDCPQSGVASRSWSVCFGNTVRNPAEVFASGRAGNDVSLGGTDLVFVGDR
jgi:hypothetical protein